MSLAEADFLRLRAEMISVVRAEVPAIVRTELAGIGMAADSDTARVSLQEHMVFLRRAKRTFDAMGGAAAKAIAALVVMAVAGFAAYFQISRP